MKISYLLLFLYIGMMLSCNVKKTEEVKLQIIPKPEKISLQEGSFQLNRNTYLSIPENEMIKSSLVLLHSMICDIAGYSLEMGEAMQQIVELDLDTTLNGTKESYHLEITPQKIILLGKDAAGLFYGVQTLRQLLTDQQFYDADHKVWNLPALCIEDQPAFSYRGLHLDVARHFFPKEFVMKCLDFMSMYKLNRFHWHLTDAAGWRIEIKQYPELTERAAWRTHENYMDWWQGKRHYASRDAVGAYGGFYTQEDIREVVEYAAAKHIMVIPEIEMPGHSEEVVSIYPYLGCYEQPYRNGEFCIGREETFEFIENVLTEVVDLFPSEYIHIGGDEASAIAWKQCPKCQKRMKMQRLREEKELQSYMIHRVEKFLQSKGRKLIGWDEILEGGLAPEATVMSWRGEKGGIKAARMGHDVVMTPGEYCYFDSYQADPRTQPAAIGGFLPYLKVYSYHPIPNELTSEEACHILGAQANLWTEYIPDTEYAEYMIFPRLLALAEVVWSPREEKDTEDFKRRITYHISFLKKKGVNAFTLSDRIDMSTEVDTIGRCIKVQFDSEKYQPEIHYSLNGREERIYKEPFKVTDSALIEAYIVKDGKKSKEILKERVDYHQAIGKKVNYKYRFNSSYPAAGNLTLTDGYRGGLTYGDGHWQGFLSDIEVIIDMDTICELSYVSANFMQLIGPGVYMPHYVAIYVSEDGMTFQEIARINNTVPSGKKELVIRDFTARFQSKGRYVKFFAKRQNGFQFVDEIVIY